MVSAKLAPEVPALNKLLLRTFIGTGIMELLIMLYESFADPDPMDAGTAIFYAMVMILCLGVQLAIYKLDFRFLLTTCPALISVITGFVLFYFLLFIHIPVLLFSVVILALAALSWQLIRG